MRNTPETSNSKSIPFLFSTKGILITVPSSGTDVLAFRHIFTVHTSPDTKESTWTVYVEELVFNKRDSEDLVNKHSEVYFQTRERSIAVQLPSDEELVSQE